MTYWRGAQTRRRNERGSARHRTGILIAAGVAPVVLSTTLGWLPAPGAGSSPPRLTELPVGDSGLNLPAISPPPAVLHALRASVGLDSGALRRRVDAAAADASLGRHAELAVEQLGRSRPILELGGRRPVTPASLLKLLTLTSALEVLGPDHRFRTSVVQGRTRSEVVLVGGGDPLLTAQRPSLATGGVVPYPRPASLAALARRTAARLHGAGVSRVHVAYDTSLFSGPRVDPAWPKSYIREDIVSPISALWVDEGRLRPGYLARAHDPPAAAAARFAELLRAQGVEVGHRITSTRSRNGARLLAKVDSAPLSEVVEHIVELSDNEGAEVLLRQVAIGTGHRGSFTAGVRAVRESLTGMGIDVAGASFTDGSGLARSDALPLSVLLSVLQHAADPAHPELSSLVTSLPVAGFTGSLAYRFTDDAPPGLGVVRAKTGTLTGVHGLAGIVTTRDGSALVFAAVADEVPVRRTLDARAQLDRVAALLAGCRCSRR
jgi:D-alanyl-D-alanine carboxypeptidase/D-alanyl-D-alanine-endopeptidase (penicillin-binding protein 4)